MSLRALVLASLLLVVTTADAQAPPACADDPVYAALDFWVGEWTVWSDGEQAGTNRILRVQDGCALEEHWTDSSGGTGQSLFYVWPADDPEAPARWRQVWVTPYARLTGGVKEKHQVEAPAGSLRFQGTLRSQDGVTFLDRTTLTPLPEGNVRQHIEISTDAGETWKTSFDAEYRPVDPA